MKWSLDPNTTSTYEIWQPDSKKYFVSGKPISFAQIADIGQFAEVVVAQENKEREFYK